MNIMNDFGFTAVDEHELEAVQQIKAEADTASEEAEVVQARLDKLYNSVLPLLTNLKSNPEKEYIYWPNRTGKIEEFETVIYNIYKGDNT